MALLDLDHVTHTFGGLRAVDDLVLGVEKGELFGLIGPNGAGKTTVFNLITGVYVPAGGDIRLAGRTLKSRPPHQICAHGVARTFQTTRLFKSMTVLDNLRTAFHHKLRPRLLGSILKTGRSHTAEGEMTRRSHELMREFRLEPVAERRAGELPYGEQRRLEIARAVATGPSLLLLDEPAAGLNQTESSELMDLIRWIRDRYELTVLLIEHDMRVVMGICERIAVLDYGRLISEGKPEDIRRDPRVIEAYLGEEVPPG